MGKHSAPSDSPVSLVEAKLTSPFVKRLAEQAVVAFVTGFAGVAFATGGNLTGAVLSGALTAGLRAAYGFVVKSVGPADTPSAQ